MRALLFLVSLQSFAQVTVTMELMSSQGTAPQVGQGVAAYTWNALVCSAGPNTVPWIAVRQQFPEIRVYSPEQTALILSTRIKRSLPARVAMYSGYIIAAGGIGVQVENTLNKSPSQLGTIITVGGLAIPAIQALAIKDTPNYSISNPPPHVIALAAHACAEYTVLAAFGKAPAVVGPRVVVSQ